MKKFGNLPGGERRAVHARTGPPVAVIDAAGRAPSLTAPDPARELAGRLANNSKMDLVWPKIRARAAELGLRESDETALWFQIRSAYLYASTPRPRRNTSYQKSYSKIAGLAKQLGAEIRSTGLNVSLFRFYSSYEAVVTYSAIAGSQRLRLPSLARLSDVQAYWLAERARIPVASAYLELATGRKPRLSDLLKRLAKAAADASEAPSDTSAELKRRGRVKRPAITLFIRILSGYLQSKYGIPMDPIVRRIAEVAFEEKVSTEDVTNALVPLRRRLKRSKTKGAKI